MLFRSDKGATEEEIKRLFARASERAPSILFIDEIDAICSNTARANGMYIYSYAGNIYICVCVCIYMNIYVDIYINVDRDICIYVYVYIDTYIDTYIHTYIYEYIYIYVCVCVCVCVCVRV